MGEAGYGYNIPKVGDFVRDKEAENPEESVAITLEAHPNTPATDRYIPSIQKNVAEVNPEYPEDAPVATVAYVDDLDSIWGWEKLASDELPYVVEANNIQTYDFPVPRLDLSGAKRKTMDKKNENETSGGSRNSAEDVTEATTSISSHNSRVFDLGSVPDNLPLDGSSDEQYVRRRSEYLRRITDLREPLPKALAYREIGYSSSGIAKKLDTRKQTVEKWMDEIAEQYGERALETRPQSKPIPDLE